MKDCTDCVDVHSHTSVMSQSECCVTVCDWLCGLRLEQYSEAFQSAGLSMLQECHNLTQDKLELMGITLPGHQRRILASLNKTHGNRDTHILTQSDTSSHIIQTERPEEDQQLEETGNSELLPRETHTPVLHEEGVLQESKKGDGETWRPTPKEREKPVPRDRQVSRLKEEKKGQKKPVLEQIQGTQTGKEAERDGVVAADRDRPVPKERTKFRSNAQIDSPHSPLISPTCDTPLPPVPPRSTPNCPPQRFTSALSPSHLAPTSASPEQARHVIEASIIQSSSVSQTTTQAPLESPALSPSRTRPQTLYLHPPGQHLGSDGGRKTTPTSLTASPSEDRIVPPLPPKVGILHKGPPPVPLRFPVQSPRTHR